MIKTDKLTFNYISRDIDGNMGEKRTALSNLSIDIEKGSFVAVLGRNGSGKSTLARQLNALLTPSSGEVFVDGISTLDAGRLTEIRQRAGMVFQNPDNQTVASVVREEVSFGPENLGLSPENIRKRVKRALSAVGMANRYDSSMDGLSGGEKQRVAIAGILSMTPDYIILDEATAMLDPSGRREVLDTVVRLNREDNMTVILITHDAEEALLADRVIVLGGGRLLGCGTPHEIFANEAIIRKAGIETPYFYGFWKKITGVEYKKSLSLDLHGIREFAADIAGLLKGKSIPAHGEISPDKRRRAAKTDALLEIDNVSYIYNAGTVYEKKALDGVSLTFSHGEFVGLAGHTGSGKSTLIQLLNGLLEPSRGRALYEGADIQDKRFSRKMLRSRVGMVFQYPDHQIIKDTVYGDVMFGPRNMGLDEEECNKRCRWALGAVGISEDLWDKSPVRMSGGQKRRVAIAGVLAMKPDYIILDEPAAGLDYEGKRDIFKLLKEICVTENTGILMVSHSMEDLARYAERVIVLDAGRVVLDGDTRYVFSQYETLIKAGLNVPVTVELVRRLRELGVTDFPDCIYGEEAEEIISYALADGSDVRC